MPEVNPKFAPVQEEVKAIWGAIRANPEVREVGTKLISALKAEMEGRVTDSKEQLDKRRKVFAAVLTAIKE